MPIQPAGERPVRDIIGYIFFFTIGLVSAGMYFYQLHPEHSMESDMPRIKRDVDDVMERGQRMREAWNDDSGDKPESTQSDTVRKD